MGWAKHNDLGSHRDGSSFRILALVEVMAPWFCDISIKSFDFTLCPIFGHHQHHMFQQDNARAHTVRATRDFLQQNNIGMMPWPALSPDLNPIEHLWDEIQRQLNEMRPRPITAADLSMTFSQDTGRDSNGLINRLIHSMYRRCVSVVNARY